MAEGRTGTQDCVSKERTRKDKLTPEQLDKFEDIFYSVSEKYLFQRKNNTSIL